MWKINWENQIKIFCKNSGDDDSWTWIKAMEVEISEWV